VGSQIAVKASSARPRSGGGFLRYVATRRCQKDNCAALNSEEEEEEEEKGG
jgi:hypothetical protein